MRQKKDKPIIIEHPKTIRKQVYEYLRDKVLNQSTEASGRMVESQIAKELGVSRTPVREALHLLEKDGFLEAIPRVGYRIKQLSLKELDEIVEIRLANETLACRWAIEKIDDTEIKNLENNIAKTKTALKKNMPHLFLAYDEEFHEILVQSARSKHLLDLCQQLRRLMLRYRTESIRTASSVKNALMGHIKILDCIKNRNFHDLEAEVKDHLNYSRQDIRNKAKSIARKNSE